MMIAGCSKELISSCSSRCLKAPSSNNANRTCGSSRQSAQLYFRDAVNIERIITTYGQRSATCLTRRPHRKYIDAPHLNFDMEVRYVRKDLMQKFNTQSQAEADAKKKQESAKF